MTNFTMTIAGEARRGEERFPVTDPATGDTFAEAPECTSAQLDGAMESARSAFRSWAKDEVARRTALVAAADAIQGAAHALARVLTREQGKPLPQALREVVSASAIFRIMAGLDLPVEVLQEKPRIELRRRPYGVVAAITPWNYPLLIAANKIAPALLAGNTMVLKPSPFTPLSTLKLGEILRDILPPGVLQVLSGGDALGRLMTEHPAVSKITFTGSVATGKKVASVAAPDLKRVTLELGGNDPAIVLGDCDPRKIARSLFWGAFMNSGQVCTAIKRVYVEESLFAPLADAVAEIAGSVKMGGGFEPDVELGPINNAPQFRRVCELVDDATHRGCRFAAGGKPRGGSGYFFEPTIVTGLDDSARLVAEEQFGPALPILPFTRLDDAIERANATHFGLSGSVWTRDVARGTAIASELDCGTAWVNQHMALSPFAPFGGSKWSGIGYENGRWGLESFCQLQVVNARETPEL
jgi:acyl-CoA reductase-like NAD-dependent aldehyde dehydrogenase